MTNEPSDNRIPTRPSISDITDNYTDAVVEANQIYFEVRRRMIDAQRKQVKYGIAKYPEPLNADTWSTIETIDHIIDETIDKLHYLTMLKIKLQREGQQ